MKHYLSPNNEIFAYELDGSQDHLIPDNFVRVTDEQVEVRRQEILQAAFDAQTYAQKRIGDYPPIGDQLDALFHAGVFPAEMAALIQAVKNKYPKT
jgi:hypothetical protein